MATWAFQNTGQLSNSTGKSWVNQLLGGAFEFANVSLELPAERIVAGDNTIEFSTDLLDEIYYIDWVNFAYNREQVAINDAC